VRPGTAARAALAGEAGETPLRFAQFERPEAPATLRDLGAQALGEGIAGTAVERGREMLHDARVGVHGGEVRVIAGAPLAQAPAGVSMTTDSCMGPPEKKRGRPAKRCQPRLHRQTNPPGDA